MPAAEVTRKVNQLDDDVRAIYELLAGLDQGMRAANGTLLRHGNRLDSLDRKFDSLDRKFDALGEKVGVHGQRLDSLDQKFDSLDQKFDSLDRKFDEVLRLLRSA